MIYKIGFKIFLIIVLVSVPLTVMQYFLQKESIELALEIADKTTPVALVDRQMQLLKQLSKYDPKNLSSYRNEFEKVVEAKIAKEELKRVKGFLVKNLLRQTVRNVLLVLGVFLVLSVILSKQIVSTFQRLLNQMKAQSARLERMHSIESWQKIARVLVHELRAPITPIKLVCTDIEYKYRVLPPKVFSEYLEEGASLIQSQVAAVEKLLESFTRFAKLPEIKRSPQSITGFLEFFSKNYNGFNQGQIQISYVPGRVLKDEISIDTDGLKHLFFNLMKNASEANPNQNLQVSIRLRQDEDKTWIEFKNTGKGISEEIAEKMFELHISTKNNYESSNFGMGLTIAKKIALEHGGDLCLTSPKENNVVFEVELPNL